MIKNVIFDVGKVLVAFDWESVFAELGVMGSAVDIVADATVRSPEWNEFDRGVIPDEELLAAFIARAPQYEDKIHAFYDDLGRTIRQYDYTYGWIRGLMAAGYRTYLLSNFPDRIYRQAEEELSFVRDVSGAVFSYTVKTVKPEPEIYKILLERYRLMPEECVFIDDRPENLKTAHKLGMKTVLFTSYEQAVEALRGLGVETEGLSVEYQRG